MDKQESKIIVSCYICLFVYAHEYKNIDIDMDINICGVDMVMDMLLSMDMDGDISIGRQSRCLLEGFEAKSFAFSNSAIRH